MSDRELLELAAKAVGIDFRYVHNTVGGQFLWNGEKLVEWNPLTDDGDSLRLAVKLDLCVGFDKDPVNYVVFVRKFDDSIVAEANIFELIKSDPYAATRRAVVRAAAEIGKSMS